MVDKPLPKDASGAPGHPPAAAPDAAPPAVPRRPPGHRGADMRDTVAEMAERAHLISQEAGTKVAHAMRDVISAGAGITGFAIESARDLVQYMVKRGQMTPEEADKLIREAEIAHEKRPASEKARPTATTVANERAAIAKQEAAARAAAQYAAMPPFRPAARPVVPPEPAPVAKPAAKSAAKETAKPAAKSAPTKTEAPAKTVAKPVSKVAAKPAAKAPAKPAHKAAAKPPAKAPAKAAKAAAKPAPKKGGKH